MREREYRKLLPELPPIPAPAAAIAACRRFVEHPVARMVGLCAVIQAGTPK